MLVDRTLRSDCREDNYLFLRSNIFYMLQKALPILKVFWLIKVILDVYEDAAGNILLQFCSIIGTISGNQYPQAFSTLFVIVRPSVRSQHTKEVQKANIRIESVPVEFTTTNFF
ncbi:unnamed protein product [Rhodiola kirilowii]